MAQDFENLVNAPISSGYFTFKSEKTWSQPDTSKYDDFFTLDMKKLSTIYNCIPLNQYIEVEDKYFTKDQLTLMNSTAEQAKKEYESALQNRSSVHQPKNKIIPTTDDAIEDDLDFLLSLKEPIRTNVSGSIAATTKLGTKQAKIKSQSSDKSKPIDLEKWLDSVLDD